MYTGISMDWTIPATGKLPADASEQVRYAFLNMDALLHASGADLGDVGRVTVFLANLHVTLWSRTCAGGCRCSWRSSP